MNDSGAYRKLAGKSKAAMVGAIELYNKHNKPSFSYRDECTVILLLNAWELLLKAFISKKRLSIYYAKKRDHPYDPIPRALVLPPFRPDFQCGGQEGLKGRRPAAGPLCGWAGAVW